MSQGVWTLFPSRSSGGGRRFQKASNGEPVFSAWVVAYSQAKSAALAGLPLDLGLIERRRCRRR